MPRRGVIIRLVLPNGAVISGANVVISAVHPSGAVVRWPAGDETYASPAVVQTDATGVVQVDLPPTDELQPEGSYYRIEAMGKVRRVLLPAGVTAIELADLPER